MKVKIVIVAFILAALPACSDETSWTTPSGLQVTEVEHGDGSIAKKGDVMSILYTASFKDGRVFDSQQDAEAPYRFRVGMKQLLPGFDEGVATMRAGARRELLLPPEIAYGQEGLAGTVPPDSWIKIDVKVLKIEPSPPPPEPWNEVGYEITTLSSGLQYIDFVVGDGKSPTPDSSVGIHFSAFLDDGTLFDSTVTRGQPIEFKLSESPLIEGLRQGLMTMREGGSRKLIIPPFLAYGEKGFKDIVPPNATLIYDVELIVVQ